MKLIVTIALGFAAGQILWELLLVAARWAGQTSVPRVRIRASQDSREAAAASAALGSAGMISYELVGGSRASLRSRLDSQAPDRLGGPVFSAGLTGLKILLR